MFCLKCKIRKFLIRLHSTKVLLNDFHHLVWIEVTAKTDCYVVWNIVSLIIVLDIGD